MNIKHDLEIKSELEDYFKVNIHRSNRPKILKPMLDILRNSETNSTYIEEKDLVELSDYSLKQVKIFRWIIL